MNYYPHHIGDYLRDTAHLSFLEDAAYRRLLDVYYRTDSPLPRDQQAIYRLVRASTRQEKLAVDIVIGEFFTEAEDGWHNKRADEEILIAKAKSAKAAESANMRWHPSENANALRTHCEGNAPNNQEPITKEKRGNARGARLPSDWQPTADLKAWALAKRPDLDPEETLARFRDYWAAAAGAKGVKLDWAATFRNWVRGEKVGPGRPALVASRPRVCAYCEQRASGSVGGVWHCGAHAGDAMDGKPVAKVAA